MQDEVLIAVLHEIANELRLIRLHLTGETDASTEVAPIETDAAIEVAPVETEKPF